MRKLTHRTNELDLSRCPRPSLSTSREKKMNDTKKNSAAADDDNLWRNLCKRFPGPGGREPEGDSTWKALYA